MEEKKKFDFIAPFKGIPAALKGFPKSWFSIAREPVKTPADAEDRRNRLWPLTYLFGSITLVLFILAVVIPGVGEIFGIIGFVTLLAVLYNVLMLSVLNKAEAKFGALTCDNCQTLMVLDTPEEYQKYVTFTVLAHDVNSKVEHPASKEGKVSYIRASARATAIVEITTKCPQCDTAKSFKFKITPFVCRTEEKNVFVRDVQLVKMSLEDKINAIVEQYKENPDSLPFTSSSIHHPEYDKKGATIKPAKWNDITINDHRTVAEMVEAYFVKGELNGEIVK